MSLDSLGTVPDLTDRVVRVSFAPTGDTEPEPGVGVGTTETATVPGTGAEDQISVGGVSNPPDYDTLSQHSRVSASEPPPEYHAVAVHE